MVMDQGNFHIVDNDLKFTIIWELAYLPKSTESYLDRSIDFIRVDFELNTFCLIW